MTVPVDNTQPKTRVFTCPQCPDVPLVMDGDIAFCETCRRVFGLGPSWIDALGQSDYYWSELDRTTMQRIIHSPDHIQQAILETVRKAEPGMKDYLLQCIFSPTRAGWKFLLTLEPGATILDIGCGLGALSMSLSEQSTCSIVADIVPERVKWTVRRLQDGGKSLAQGLVSSGLPHLPLPEASVDLVVINGVLEWIPASVEGEPDAVQQAFLTEVARVLKPSGQLYLGIENRYGASYFRGKREEHTRLRFISLLPRPLGRAYHRLAGKGAYRTYTHGRKRLLAMLEKAGFPQVDVYCPYPDYREFSAMVDLNDVRWMKHSFSPKTLKGKVANWVAIHTGLLAHLTNSFGIVAHRGQARPTFLRRLFQHLIDLRVLSDGAGVWSYHIRATGCVSVVAGVDCPSTLISLPLDGRAERRLKRDAQMAASILSLSRMEESGVGIVPDQDVIFEGITVAVSTAAQGIRLDSLNVSTWTQYSDAAWGWLTRFHGAHIQTLACPATFLLPVGTEDALARLDVASGGNLQRVLRQCKGRIIRKSPVHGDFHSGNIFVASDGRVERVVDWDLAEMQGLPLWDALTFLLHPQLEKGLSWAAAYTYLFNLCLPTISPHHRLSGYIHDLGLGPVDVVLAMVTLPVMHLHSKLLYTEEDGDAIVDGTVRTLDTGRVQLLEAVLTGWADVVP